MGAVYFLTIRQLAGKWRLAIMAVLAALPVLIAALTLSDEATPSVTDFEGVVLSGMLAGSILPLIVLAIAASAFANELEDRTLANLTLSPIPRWQIAVPKLLGTITLAAPFIAISAALTAHIGFLADARATAAVTVGALTGVALYAAAFVWLGLWSTQAIGIGLVYIVLWEGFIAGFVSGVRNLSIRHYATGMMHAIDGRRFADGAAIEPLPVLIVTLAVFGGFLALSIRRLRRMDVP